MHVKVFSGTAHKTVHFRFGEIDHRARHHGFDLVVIALVEGFDMAPVGGAKAWDGRKSSSAEAGLSAQKDAPEQAVWMFTHVDLVQPIPVFFHFPDEFLVRGKLFGPALSGGMPDFDRPQVVGDEMKEIAQSEGKARRIFRGNIGQITTIEIQVGDVLVDAVAAFEMRDLWRRVELLPIFVGDAGIRRNIADGKLTGVEAGNTFEQIFSDAQVRDPGGHYPIIPRRSQIALFG